MNHLSDLDKGYIAGMLDGEGTITITKHRQYNRKTLKFQYRPFIWIVNTNKESLESIQQKCGIGSIVIKEKNTKYKTCYVYRISSRNGCMEFLHTIKDRLIIKKKQSELLLQFLEKRKIHQHPNSPYSQDEIRIHEKIKKLNQR